jgi:predicted RNase H-like HicB family nuclease
MRRSGNGRWGSSPAWLSELWEKTSSREMGLLENRYTAVFEKVGDWWTGYVEELPGCNVREPTLDEARKSLNEVIRLILDANRELAGPEGHQGIREEVAVPVE